ncbi:DUF1194 domain-containing protein [Mesorhizobium sp. B3-1-7]|uniref:DUF1194 domain-containing protein n=1 Tax=Mesorhizobium sp. B3-1-7 TaxID=2589894 RepID=UPI0015E46782|nr:DUF1194 domain-containing protein [Mesorhizobium sp. B3-1-7]
MSMSAAAEPVASVDLELVLSVDVSSSMSEAEQRLQRQGHIEAFQDAKVWQSIKSGRRGRIGITYVEWAGPNHQSVRIPWTILEGPEDAAAFVQALRAQPIVRGLGTSISGALLLAGKLLAGGPAGDRQVIDVSGDGPNNAGLPLQPVHDALIADGVTINGLVISLHHTTRSIALGRALLSSIMRAVLLAVPGRSLSPSRAQPTLQTRSEASS